MKTNTKKPGVMLYFESADRISKLKPMQRLSVYEAIVQYGKEGTVPALKREADLVWDSIKPILDRDGERYQKVLEARIKGGRIRGTKMKQEAENKLRELKLIELSSESQSPISNPQSPVSNPQSPVSNPQSPVSNPQSPIPSLESPIPNPHVPAGTEGMGPPSLEEVKKFIIEEQLRILPEDFWDYYTANGWTVGGVPVRDWHALARRWSRREKTEEESVSYGIVI